VRNRIVSQFSIALGALAVLFMPISLAFAADPLQSITASPTDERISLAAAGNYDGTVKITNTGQTGYDFSVSASPFTVEGENYDLSFTARPDLVDASKWFSFSRTVYTAAPTNEIEVPYHVKVPADIAAGGYYAVIFAESKAPSTSQGITAHKRVGVLFYLTVTGNTITSGKLLSYSVPIIHTAAPLTAQARMENTGNVHFDTSVSLTVSDIFGNTKARLDSTNLIFPKSTRKIGLGWTGAPSFGLFRVTGTISYLGKTHSLPARYTLMLSATAFVVLFVAIVALCGYIFLTRRRRGNIVRRR
jgi:hypothetical protein